LGGKVEFLPPIKEYNGATRKGGQMWKDNLRVGKPDVAPDRPAHTPGVNAGNEPGGMEADPGIHYTGEQEAGRPTAVATMRLATGINPELRNPIDPNSPTLPPP
jgi:hypothetical protein